MASRKTKLSDISHNIQRSLTARSNIKTTATQTKAVRNNSKRIMVLGKTTACKPPVSKRSKRAPANELLKPKSISPWY